MTRPLKITFMIPALSDGGAQKQLIALLNTLQDAPDLELGLLRLHPGVHDGLLRTDALTIDEIDLRTNYDPRALHFIGKTLARRRPDIVMSWLHACDVYAGLVLAKTPGPRWIMAERNSAYPRTLPFLVRNHLGRRADAIVSNSRAGDAYWARLRPRAKRFVIDNIAHDCAGITPPEHRSGPILYVGRLEAQKNVSTLARAFGLLARMRPHLRFAMIGAGSARDGLAAIIAAGQCADRIALPGFTPAIAPRLAKARLLVSISHHEGLPNTLIEAVTLGTPIVASNICEHRDLLGPHYPFYVDDFTRPAAVARVMERALDTPWDPRLFDFARARLARMQPGIVAAAYRDVFETVLTRAVQAAQ